MLQLIHTTSTAVSAGGKIPASVDFNTNQNMIGFDPATNEIIFRQPGIYQVTAVIVYTPTAAGLNAIYAYSSTNAAAVAGMTSSFKQSAATQTATYTITKNVRINSNPGGVFARMNFVAQAAGNVENAIIRVEKIR